VLGVLLAETWVFLKSLRRRKDLLFWLIVFPVVYMLLVNTLFAPREAMVSFKVGVIDMDGGDLSRALVEAMNKTEVLRPAVVSGDPGELLRRGEYASVLVIPEGFSGNITSARQATLQLYILRGSTESEAAARVVEGFIAGFREVISATAVNVVVQFIPEPFRGYLLFISNPLLVEYNNVTYTRVGALQGFKISLVTLTIGVMFLFVGLMSGIHAIVEKRYEGYVQAVLSSHVNPTLFMLSEIIAILVGSLITASVIAATGILLGAPLLEVPVYKLLLALLIIIVSVLGLIGLGMVLGTLVRTPHAAAALGNAIAFPMIFLGGFAIPKFLLPSWLQVIPEVFPHSRLMYAATYYILGAWSFWELVEYAIPAVVLSLTLLLAGALVYRRALEKLYESP